MVAERDDGGGTIPTGRPSNTAVQQFRRVGGSGLVLLILVAQVAALGLLVLVAPGAPFPHAVLILLALCVMWGNRVLGPQVGLSALDRLPGVLAAFAGATGTVAAGYALVGQDEVAIESLRFGPLALLVSWVMVVATYAMGRRARRRGWFVDRVIVLGSGKVAEALQDSLADRPAYGLVVVGHVTSEEAESGPVSPWLGFPDDLFEACRLHDARLVIVAYSRDPESKLLGPVRECVAAHIRVLVVPRFFEDLDRHQVGDGIWGMPLQRLPIPTGGRARRATKRAIDVALASAALVLLLPVMIVSGLAIQLETQAGIFFRQTRVGRDERPITILKFQTMKPSSDAEGDTTWSISDDPRLGPVGRFLRRTSLDELPQLWNVIRGDMSLVGPRPERPHFVAQFKEEIPSYGARHRVPVGLTGWAQVHELRGDSSIEERARFDNAYAASWSPWEDVKILLRTIPEVLRGGGE
jgi:exopolysaccharide biosynthesis polyprenyl glycosylphosphotransferase